MKAKRKPAPVEVPITFTRADPVALAAFDPATKLCVMNCGPHRDDPRTLAERRFLCGDCCWVGCGECDSAFPCYSGQARCIRL